MSTADVTRAGRGGRGRAGRWGFVLALAATGWLVWSIWPPSVNELVRSSRAALRQGAAEEALRLAHRAVARAPHSAQALLAAGESALALSRTEAALAYFCQIDNDGIGDRRRPVPEPAKAV